MPKRRAWRVADDDGADLNTIDGTINDDFAHGLLRTNANIAFRCAYHVVWCPKYRRRVIGEKGAWLVELQTMPDQVHLLVEVDPQLRIHRLVKAVKGRSSRVLQA